MYAVKIVSIGICLNNKIFSNALLNWCQNYGISFEHSGRATGTPHSRRGSVGRLKVSECKSGTSARDRVECKRGSSDGITAACFTRTRAQRGRVPAGSGVPQAAGGFAVAWRNLSRQNVRGFHCYEKFR